MKRYSVCLPFLEFENINATARFITNTSCYVKIYSFVFIVLQNNDFIDEKLDSNIRLIMRKAVYVHVIFTLIAC